MCCACGGGESIGQDIVAEVDEAIDIQVEDSDDAISTDTYGFSSSIKHYFEDPVTVMTWVLGFTIPLITCTMVILCCQMLDKRNRRKLLRA